MPLLVVLVRVSNCVHGLFGRLRRSREQKSAGAIVVFSFLIKAKPAGSLEAKQKAGTYHIDRFDVSLNAYGCIAFAAGEKPLLFQSDTPICRGRFYLALHNRPIFGAGVRERGRARRRKQRAAA